MRNYFRIERRIDTDDRGILFRRIPRSISIFTYDGIKRLMIILGYI